VPDFLVGANETPDPDIPGVVLEILGVKQDGFGDLEQVLLENIKETMSLLGGGEPAEDDEASEDA
jgi:hypothetical protein